MVNNQEYIRTIKNIQTCFNFKISSSQHKKQLGKEIISSCKIHMVEEETLERGTKSGIKEELGEKE